MLTLLRSCDPLAALCWTYSTIRVIGCIIHNLYCIPAYCILNLLQLPLYYISVDNYAKVENVLYNWLLYVVSSWSWGAGLIVHEHGDDIYTLRKDPNVRLLVIANHQSTADVPLMMQAFTSRSEYVLLWVMDAVFKWTNFGLVSQTHGDYFINTKAYKNGTILKHCTSEYSRLKNLVVLFPEGGFRYKRQASSNSYAMKQNLPILSTVTYPRFGAYSECIDPLVGITHVVDLTICYDDVEHPPSIVDIVRGRRVCEIHFYYRVHSVIENPDVRTEAWLREQWQLKDHFLADHYAAVQRSKQNLKNGVSNHGSVKTSLNGSLRSKPSYSSMSPMSLSKEQLNMLGNSQDGTLSCPGALQQQHNHDNQSSTIPLGSLTNSPNGTRTPSTEDLSVTFNNNNNSINMNNNGYHQVLLNGGCTDTEVGDLTNHNHHHHYPNGTLPSPTSHSPSSSPSPSPLPPAALNSGTQWSSHGSLDSNFPPTPNTDDLMSRHLVPAAPFDRSAGRPVVMSWPKLLLIHAFYLSVILIIYEVFVLLVFS